MARRVTLTPVCMRCGELLTWNCVDADVPPNKTEWVTSCCDNEYTLRATSFTMETEPSNDCVLLYEDEEGTLYATHGEIGVAGIKRLASFRQDAQALMEGDELHNDDEPGTDDAETVLDAIARTSAKQIAYYSEFDREIHIIGNPSAMAGQYIGTPAGPF